MRINAGHPSTCTSEAKRPVRSEEEEGSFFKKTLDLLSLFAADMNNCKANAPKI